MGGLATLVYQRVPASGKHRELPQCRSGDPGLGCFVFVQERDVTRGAVGIRQTTSDRIKLRWRPERLFLLSSHPFDHYEQADRNDKSEALEDP